MWQYVLINAIEFFWCLGSLPGTMHAHKLIAAFKSKCSPEEAAILLKDLPNVYPNGQENGEN